jgi:hypothetical protein
VNSEITILQMTTKEIIIAFTIHLIIPLVGLLFFLQLNNKIKREKIDNAPTTELFVIFANYGGLLLVILTALFWQWSGMASLGLFYLILGAPRAMGFIAYSQRQKKTISNYHDWTYNAALYIL